MGTLSLSGLLWPTPQAAQFQAAFARFVHWCVRQGSRFHCQHDGSGYGRRWHSRPTTTIPNGAKSPEAKDGSTGQKQQEALSRAEADVSALDAKERQELSALLIVAIHDQIFQASEPLTLQRAGRLDAKQREVLRQLQELYSKQRCAEAAGDRQRQRDAASGTL